MQRVATDVVRYEPVEALRWLKFGAGSMRQDAIQRSGEIVRREGARTIGKDLSQAAGALFGMGKSAMADLLHASASATEFVISDTEVQVIRATQSKRYAFSEAVRAERQGDKVYFVFSSGTVEVSPYAYITSGRIKAPLGWNRNGLEVPFTTLVEELAARCGVGVQDV